MDKIMRKSKRNMSYEQKGQLWSYLFLVPWLLGLVFFFAIPFLQAFIYAFNDVKVGENEIIKKFNGIDNFIFAFKDDPVFIRTITETISSMVFSTTIIIFFSIFVAILLNAKFRGRTVARAVFFLPVIVASGVIISILKNDSIARLIMSGGSDSVMFQASGLNQILIDSGLPVKMVDLFISVINGIFELSWKSGIQILLFLAGLQTIPRAMYEAANIEGASKWEGFWKITFPMISPIILLNVIFTITEGFTDYSNETMKWIMSYSSQLKIGYSSALALIYFVVIFVVIGVVYLIINRRTFYITD